MNEPHDITVIPYSRRKGVKSLAGGAALLAACVLIACCDIAPPGFWRDHETIFRSIGWSGLAFFSVLVLLSVLPMLDPRSGVVLDSECISVRSLLFPLQVRWTDIAALEGRSVQSVHILGLRLKDGAAYFRGLSALRRWLYRLNLRFGHCPVAINVTPLAIRRDAFLDLVRDYHDHYGH